MLKRHQKVKKKNINLVRKSIIALRKIEKGETFSIDNIAIKRPGRGLSPMKWDKYIGKKARRNFRKNSFIK